MTTSGTGCPVYPVGMYRSKVREPARSVWVRCRICPPAAAAAAVAAGLAGPADPGRPRPRRPVANPCGRAPLTLGRFLTKVVSRSLMPCLDDPPVPLVAGDGSAVGVPSVESSVPGTGVPAWSDATGGGPVMPLSLIHI